MTLGQKLSTYRKLAGLTQQQLGEQLNISAQAVSKWENDQAEPDLATMRTLAGIYKVSVDDLLDPDSVPHVSPEETESQETLAEESAPASVPPIGFCKRCGIAVTEENLGVAEPVILCAKCLKAKNDEAKRAAERAKGEAAQEKKRKMAELSALRAKYKKHIVRTTVVASIVMTLFLALMIYLMVVKFSGARLATAFVGSYIVFAFVWCLQYDCVVQDVVLSWSAKTIQWPGLIFTFDVDGCLWLIGMKLLFWILGLLFGLVTGAFGTLIGIVCAPFVFPFQVVKAAKAYNAGEPSEFMDQSILMREI